MRYEEAILVPVIGLVLVLTGVVLLFLSFHLRLRPRARQQPQLRLLRNAQPAPARPARSRVASARTPLRVVSGFKS